VADDVYERLYYGPAASPLACAPGFLDFATSEDRVIGTNSFSKAWLMTGWRLGWMVAPRPLVEHLGTLIEYNTSCAPEFVQRAGLAALRDGETVVAQTRERLRRARDRLIGELNAIPGLAARSLPERCTRSSRRRHGDSLLLRRSFATRSWPALAAFGGRAITLVSS
jgi:aspartate/methionine/tyrosine aminotransferase